MVMNNEIIQSTFVGNGNGNNNIELCIDWIDSFDSIWNGDN